MHVAPALRRYIVDLVEATRRHADVYLGASPRASIMILRAARAYAAAEERDFVIPDDVKALAVARARPPHHRHRRRRDERPLAPRSCCRRSSPRCRCRSRRAPDALGPGPRRLRRRPGDVGRGPHRGLLRARGRSAIGLVASAVPRRVVRALGTHPHPRPPAALRRAGRPGHPGHRAARRRERCPGAVVVPAGRGPAARRARPARAARGLRHPGARPPRPCPTPSCRRPVAATGSDRSRSTSPIPSR